MASIFLFAWSAGAGSVAAAIAVLLVVLAASAEGLIAIWELAARGTPLVKLRDLNIDAITAWKYHGLRIDGVHRTMLYTPQHGLSCALALLGLVPVAQAGVGAPLGVVVATGLLLGLSTAVNPFLGAAFSLDLRALHRRRRSPQPQLRHGTPSSRVGRGAARVAVVWGTVNGMGSGAGGALTFGLAGFARNAPIADAAHVAGPGAVAGTGRIRARPSPANASGDARRLRTGRGPRPSVFRDAVGKVLGWLSCRADPARDADRAAGQCRRAAAGLEASLPRGRSP